MCSGSISAIQQTNYNTKHSQNISKHLQISNHPCTANPGKFWLHTHTFTRTLLHAYPTHSLDYKVTLYNLPMHTPVRKVRRLTRTDPGCGSPWQHPTLSLCCLHGFQERRLCGHPYTHLLLACHSLSPSHAVPMRSRTTPADTQKYGFILKKEKCFGHDTFA